MLKLTDNTYRELPGIYIIKNLINGKEYVGQSGNIKSRIYHYRRKIRSMIIGRAIKKHGIENFQVYVEYFPLLTPKELGQKEYDTIRDCNTKHPNGYNLADGGLITRGWKHTPESLQKISAASTGKNNPMFGISRKRDKNPNAKKVAQYTKDGELIKIWNCMADAQEVLGILQGNISSCCSGKLKSCGGFIWKHTSEDT